MQHRHFFLFNTVGNATPYLTFKKTAPVLHREIRKKSMLLTLWDITQRKIKMLNKPKNTSGQWKMKWYSLCAAALFLFCEGWGGRRGVHAMHAAWSRGWCSGGPGRTIADRLGVLLHVLLHGHRWNAAHARWYLHLQGTTDWSEMGTWIYTGSLPHTNAMLCACVFQFYEGTSNAWNRHLKTTFYVPFHSLVYPKYMNSNR